jgi:hypothetical protein
MANRALGRVDGNVLDHAHAARVVDKPQLLRSKIAADDRPVAGAQRRPEGIVLVQP